MKSKKPDWLPAELQYEVALSRQKGQDPADTIEAAALVIASQSMADAGNLFFERTDSADSKITALAAMMLLLMQRLTNKAQDPVKVRARLMDYIITEGIFDDRFS